LFKEADIKGFNIFPSRTSGLKATGAVIRKKFRLFIFFDLLELKVGVGVD